MTHYDTLGCPPGAILRELHVQFIFLSKRYHPDTGAAADLAKYQEITAAWGVLKNQDTRAAYDRELKLTHKACSGCGGSGLTSKQTHFTRVRTFTCSKCKGAGYV